MAAPRGTDADPHRAGGGSGAHLDRDAEERLPPIVVGVFVWLVSETMLFGGFFAAYFVLKAHNEPSWPPPQVVLDPGRTLVFTLVLVASSVTFVLAERAARAGRWRHGLAWRLATLALGAAFLANQALEYASLGFAFDDSAYSTIFYLLTGFHGAHVIVGLVLIVVVGWVAFSRGSRSDPSSSFRVTGYYWHFVDVVWIFLFLVVYVMQ